MKIIAEIGSVHDGSFGNALKLIDAAADAGADTIKFQTHIAEAETVPNAPSPSYFNTESRLDYFKRTSFTKDQWRQLAEYTHDKGLIFLSSPFSLEAVDLLEEIGINGFKIPSGEVSNTPLLERIAQTGKLAILSSGMSSWTELDEAVSILNPKCELIILQCSSIYPCPPDRVGLNVIHEMAKRYKLPIGYSDHTLGLAAPIAAVALGAKLIEKHFTFSRKMYGSDAPNSMEPTEFKIMAEALHEVWAMLDNPVNKADLHPYIEMKRVFEKSIVASRLINANEVITRDMITFKKPGDGISASNYRSILGRVAKKTIISNHKIGYEDLF